MVSQLGRQDGSQGGLGALPGIVRLDRRHPSVHDIQHLRRHLVRGGAVVLPTETQYALSVDATNCRAVEFVRQIKGRSQRCPFSVFFATRDALSEWRIAVPAWAEGLAGAFWPGPLTLILPMRNRVLGHLGDRSDAIGVRITPEPVVTALCRQVGKPLIATSANPSGFLLSPAEENRWLHTQASMGCLLWVRPPRFRRRPPSTVLDCTGRRPRLVRRGIIPVAVWQKVVRQAKRGT